MPTASQQQELVEVKRSKYNFEGDGVLDGKFYNYDLGTEYGEPVQFTTFKAAAKAFGKDHGYEVKIQAILNGNENEPLTDAETKEAFARGDAVVAKVAFIKSDGASHDD